MSMIQPGSGYGFTSGGFGFTLNTENPFPQETQIDIKHPLKIVNVSIVVSGGSPKVQYQIVPGTINNLMVSLQDKDANLLVLLNRTNPTTGQPNPPTGIIDSAIYDETKTAYIVMSQGPAIAPPKDYPDPTFVDNSTRYPQIIALDTTPEDVDARGYLCLGTITVDNVTAPTTFTVNQFITGSLWSDRIKLGTLTAKYYYARI
jgi:hypothetical protein